MFEPPGVQILGAGMITSITFYSDNRLFSCQFYCPYFIDHKERERERGGEGGDDCVTMLVSGISI